MAIFKLQIAQQNKMAITMATNNADDVQYASTMLERIMKEIKDVMEQRVNEGDDELYFERDDDGNVNEQFAREVIMEFVEGNLHYDGKDFQSANYIFSLMNWDDVMRQVNDACDYESYLMNDDSSSEDSSEDSSECDVIPDEECDDPITL